MKRYSLLIPILALALSCSKEKESRPTTNTHTCLLTESIDSATGKEKITYDYDDGYRLVKISYSVPDMPCCQHEEYQTFTYVNGLNMQIFRSNKPPLPKITYDLNADGNIVRSVAAYPDTSYSEPGFLRDTTVYTYTQDKKLLQQRFSRTILSDNTNVILYRNLTTTSYQYAAGRLSKKVQNFERSTPAIANETTYVFEYFYNESSPTVKFNPVVSDQPDLARGMLMSDKIPIKEIFTVTGGDSTSYASTTEYTSIVNEMGFPLKIRGVTKSSGLLDIVATKLYNYSCH